MEKEKGEKVLQWYRELGLEEAAQTVTEHNEVDSKLLQQMVEKRKAAGEGVFFHETSGNVPLFKKFSSLVCLFIIINNINNNVCFIIL